METKVWQIETAREFIKRKRYAEAKKLLQEVSTLKVAQQWLERIHEIEQRENNVVSKVVISNRLEEKIKKYLISDEEVIWYEQPNPAIFSQYMNPRWHTLTYFIGGISMLLVIFAGLYVQTALTQRTFIPPACYLNIFLIIIFTLMPFFRELLARRRANAVHYILTTRQAFIIDRGHVDRILFTDKMEWETIPEKHGLSSLIFKRKQPLFNAFFVKTPSGFLGIKEAHQVRQMISEAWKDMKTKRH
jgi:hypothetical protein